MSEKLTFKVLYLLVAVLIAACDGNKSTGESPNDGVDTSRRDDNPAPTAENALKTYANERFKNVTVQRVGETQFRVEGEGQIFEANFGWVVEDGHNELKKGFEMTDAGAPAWGKFSFTVDVEKQRPNSTLTLVLFETSAKDGSRVHELAIPLK